RSDYQASYNSATQTYTITVLRTGWPEGTDQVTGIELFRFANMTVAAADLVPATPNSAPTGATLSGNTVAENAPNGTVIGTVSGTDPDAGSTFTYSLTGTAGGRFAINATTGQITVANGALLDYESATSQTITVRVTDQGGLFLDKTFTIG